MSPVHNVVKSTLDQLSHDKILQSHFLSVYVGHGEDLTNEELDDARAGMAELFKYCQTNLCVVLTDGMFNFDTSSSVKVLNDNPPLPAQSIFSNSFTIPKSLQHSSGPPVYRARKKNPGFHQTGATELRDVIFLGLNTHRYLLWAQKGRERANTEAEENEWHREVTVASYATVVGFCHELAHWLVVHARTTTFLCGLDTETCDYQ